MSSGTSNKNRFTTAVPPLACATLALSLVAATLATTAGAQGGPGGAGTRKPAADTRTAEQRKDEAKARFERGMALFDKKVWDAALVEFMESRAAYPTRSNTQNAAICLRNLGRSDEALELFEALVREVTNLSPADRAAVDKEITELQAMVGAIEVRTPEADAQITIDGRERGVTPSPALRVPAGTHVLRVYKEGFAPIERRIAVASRQTQQVEARLEPLAQSGRLSVTEDGSRGGAEVLVDNVVVGKTPWQGVIALGDHVVFLRGEGNLGTQPAAATVRINQVTPIVLALEPLESKLRVEPTPGGAQVAVDGVVVGSGVWDGRLRKGRHTIEVAQAGFIPQRREMNLAPGSGDRISVRLERDPDSPLWQAQKKPRIFVELAPAFPLTVIMGGGVADSGSASFPLGVVGRAHVGYEVPSGVGVALDAGYLYLARDVSGRDTMLRPVGKAEARGVADDELSLRGLLIGASAHLHRNQPFGEKMPLLLRVGLGVLLGSASDRRTGAFTPAGGTLTPVAASRTTDDAAFLYVAPEARLGYRIGERLELSAGLELMVLVGLSKARWDTQGSSVLLGNQGLAGYDNQTLVGSTLLLVNPGVGARYEF